MPVEYLRRLVLLRTPPTLQSRHQRLLHQLSPHNILVTQLTTSDWQCCGPFVTFSSHFVDISLTCQVADMKSQLTDESTGWVTDIWVSRQLQRWTCRQQSQITEWITQTFTVKNSVILVCCWSVDHRSPWLDFTVCDFTTRQQVEFLYEWTCQVAKKLTLWHKKSTLLKIQLADLNHT